MAVQLTAERQPINTDAPLISIMEPVPWQTVHAQPRVRWFPLEDIPEAARLRCIVREVTSGAKHVFDIDRRGDFFIPHSLEKGSYQITILAEFDGMKLKSRGLPVTVDWDKANEGRFDCVSPWRHLFVLGKNRVRPCCMMKEGVIFHTNPNDLGADLWNNHGLMEMRVALRTGDSRYCHSHCGGLKRWGSHEGVAPADIESYRRGDVIQDVPTTLKLSLGSHCNHKCTFCKMGSARYNHWEQQDYAFEYLINNAPRIWKLFLTGGEPLVHFKRHRQRLLEAFSRSSDLRVELQTNGALIDRYLDVLTAIPDLTLSVSMAGSNREDYAKLHRVDDFDKVCANLKTIREARGDKPTAIEIKMVYTKQNYRGVPQFPGVAHDVGANQIYFHHLMILAKTDIDPIDEIKEIDPEYPALIEGLQQAHQRADQYGLQMRVTGRDHKKVREFNTKDVIETETDDEDE